MRGQNGRAEVEGRQGVVSVEVIREVLGVHGERERWERREGDACGGGG